MLDRVLPSFLLDFILSVSVRNYPLLSFLHVIESLPPDDETDGDLGEGLHAAVVVPDRPGDVGLLQQLPLTVRHVVAQVHDGGPVHDVNLKGEETEKENHG